MLHTQSSALRRRSHIRRGLATGLLLTLGLVVASSSSVASTTRAQKPATATRAASQPAIVGTWRRLTTCAELASALTKAGMKKLVLEMVAGNGFIPGVTAPGQIADPTNPCKGAVPRRHSHFFTKNREFGSLDWRGRQVDDGTYRLVRGQTIVIYKEFPKVTFHFRIRGKTITFAPVIPKGCTSFRCAWAISVAYPGKTWQRVR
jgi:hypothetical protein